MSEDITYTINTADLGSVNTAAISPYYAQRHHIKKHDVIKIGENLEVNGEQLEKMISHLLDLTRKEYPESFIWRHYE